MEAVKPSSQEAGGKLLKFVSEISRFVSRVAGLEESWSKVNLLSTEPGSSGGCDIPALHPWLGPREPNKYSREGVGINYNANKYAKDKEIKNLHLYSSVV